MRRSKNMIEEKTTESRELYLFSTNCGYKADLYNAITENLEKKVVKGIYNHEKAVDAYYRLMQECDKVYNKHYDYKFTVTEKFNAAVEAAEAFELDNDIK